MLALAQPLHGPCGSVEGSKVSASPTPLPPPALAPQANLVKQINKLVKVRYVEDITESPRIGGWWWHGPRFPSGQRLPCPCVS